MDTSPRDEAPRRVLERMRMRLLDLSARNPLLNYAHPRASSLRIVDEVPTVVLDALIANRAYRFASIKVADVPAPVADPAPRGFVRSGRTGRSANATQATHTPNVTSAAVATPPVGVELQQPQTERERREAARAARAQREEQIRAAATALGIDPSYDLLAAPASDAARHGDTRLQTLLTADELEARLQKMQASAVTAIQESGANMLHLLFGFVEWTDVAGEKTRLAPLVLLPVTMSRLALDPATHTYPYTVAASGEDWSTNVTLQEMCRKSFGFALPSVEQDEGLEQYFSRVEEVLRVAAPQWKLRRQLTLGLVSFGKILMWRDLDPATWPADHDLLAVPLLRQVLGDGDLASDPEDHASAELRATEYNIDALPADRRPVPPIVVPADSSQHSVLVDVQRGENLVVQGPPGTGKSQTITNMIADAIAVGKKVLFVAEKKAALDVVARRLEDAGLGPFILPLHSHTSNKREFLDLLKARIDLPATDGAANELMTVDGLLAESRKELTGHVERLHRPFGSLGLTAFDVLWRARRLGGDVPERAVDVLRDATIANAKMVTASEAAKHRATLQAFSAAHAAVVADAGANGAHPWQGMSRADLSFDAAQSLVALARLAREALESAERARRAMASDIGSVAWPDSPEALLPLLSRVRHIVAPDADVPATLIDAVHARAGESATEAAVQAADASRQAWSEVKGAWGVAGAISPDAASEHAAALRDAMKMLGDEASVGTIKEAVGLLSEVLDHLLAVQAVATRIAASLGVTHELPVGVALGLVTVAMAVERLPNGALSLRSIALQAPNAADRVASLAERAAELTRARELRDARFNPEMRPSLAELRRVATALAEAPRFMPGLFSGSYRDAAAAYRRMSGGRQADRATMTADVEALIRFASDYQVFMSDPNLETYFGSAARGVDTPFESGMAVLDWTRHATVMFRGTSKASQALTDAVWNASPQAWREACETALTSPEGRHAAHVLGDDLSAVVKFKPGDIVLWDPLPFATIEDQLHRWRDIALGGVRAATSAGAVPSDSLASLANRLVALRRAWDGEATLESHAETFRQLGWGQIPKVSDPLARGVVSADPATSLGMTSVVIPSERSESRDLHLKSDALRPVRGALAYLSQLRERGLPKPLIEWLTTGDPRARVATLQQHVAAVTRAIESASAAERTFAAAGAVDTSAWYGAWQRGATFEHRIGRFHRAVEGSGTLARWATRLRARANVLAGPISAACELLESGAVPGDQLPVLYDYLLVRTLAEQVLRERTELDRFSGSVHETRRTQFAKLDERAITLTRSLVAQRADAIPRVRGVGYGPVSELSEQSLIEHEIDKSRRHIPIREMFRRAGRAIQALKPCIMMGPQAVAQYLPPGRFHFDLVVMDEASQMRPEDALGAIARGAQLVVVGDPKQLGPTSFFDTVSSDEEEIEEAAALFAASRPERAQGDAVIPSERSESRDLHFATAGAGPSTSLGMTAGVSVLERSESILLAAARRYPLRMLRWHYRSRYPELIAFSNQEFYGNGLVLFPHPGTEREGDGVNFRAVKDALYATSLNPREAEAIVEAVRRHAKEQPERTLMVVTMNQPQRELVDTLVQNAEKDDPALAAFRERHQNGLEPFAVKNLENVQGDERDVIIVGVTYGPDERGIVAQHFGPINATGGERRLNVLFTRAKFRLDVFCSFDPTALRITEQSPRGLCVLRDYLRFAKEKNLATGRFTAREPESDFEVEVARSLRTFGYDVHAQVGVAGYHLDLAVVDPEHPGRYLLAIECDGATYHSAKSARDRDRLRQEVLERLGWQVHRIWSTDWFRDPQGETSRVVSRAAAARG